MPVRRSLEFYTAGACLDPADPAIVCLARAAKGGWGLERWRTHDGGRSRGAEQIAGPSRGKHLRPFVPRGASADLRLLWLHGRYRHYTSYRTRLLADPPTAALS